MDGQPSRRSSEASVHSFGRRRDSLALELTARQVLMRTGVAAAVEVVSQSVVSHDLAGQTGEFWMSVDLTFSFNAAIA